MQSVNPATGEVIQNYSPHSTPEIGRALARAQHCFETWKFKTFDDRAKLMRDAAKLLRDRKTRLAGLMQEEMGKTLKDGKDEIEKCAVACEYYAENAQRLLADEPLASDGKESFVTYQPLGAILAVMPWNFPFWQVFRFAAPNLMAGNVGVLKHASNVCGCALAIEAIFRDAHFPDGAFTTLLVSGKAVSKIIENPVIAAVTLTGSAEAGSKVAAKAGECLKKTVLELGGSDAYVVLADADIAQASKLCAQSRLINMGQSCIAAKRFIVVKSVLRAFEDAFIDHFKEADISVPMARSDLRDSLHDQVTRSIDAGAKLRVGGIIPAGPGAFYPPTVLAHVKPGMPAFDEELFGPVAAIIEAEDEDEAFRLANLSRFGLGSALFTSDAKRGTQLACTRLDAGQAFINSFVRSDPRMPFGGIKESGYGRELGAHGIREFVNAKTVYIA